MATALTGTGVSTGIAIGPVVQMGTPVGALPTIRAKADPEVERERAERALDEVAADLERRRERASGEAESVLEALAMMASDPALRDAVAEHTGAGQPAPHAVQEGLRGFRDALLAAGGYLAERAADLDDLRNRAIARLLHLPMPGVPDHPGPFVLVAEDLAPADTVDLDPERIVALVTERGGPTSHTAIIAKAMGLPAIVSCPGIMDVEDGTTLIVDGSTGIVTVDPAGSDVAAAEERRAARAELLATSSGPGRTADGRSVQLLLNLGSSGEADAADVDAEGVGLLRTEFLFLDRGTEPSVAEQTEAYARVFAAFGGRKVVIRTLDVGADKPLPFVEPGPGDNPALGLRGWRLREHNPGLLERQLEAIAAADAAAQCETWVMAPMIATTEEAEAFVTLAHGAGLAKAGVMVEIPSVALQAEHLMQVVDFASIGTNDLSQYTFAADRMVGELGLLLDAWQPALVELVVRTARAGAAAGVPIGVCGEAASDPLLALVFAGAGCSSLSMSRGALPEVRASLAGVTMADCEALVEVALGSAGAGEARAAVADRVG
jgi:phosphoenolpyruvate-protein phosphotransferase (PTS system enzyme I)